MLECANKQVASSRHLRNNSKQPLAIAPIGANCCNLVPRKLNSEHFNQIRPLLFLLLLLFVGFVSCNLNRSSSNESIQVEQFQTSQWKPAPLAAAASTTSEISFEHQNLKSVPETVQMCQSPQADQVRQKASPINVASFAHNQIGQLERNAFTCLAENLKILILRHNEIERISIGAFEGLKSVQVLLLDNNLLDEVPSKAALSPLKALRHLNLAHNKIRWLDNETFGSESANLISLNLKGNPLSRLSSNSLTQLVRLKTLTLSHSALSDRLEPLRGLIELRFYQLDRAANLSSISADLCVESRKLSSLVLKSNQLEQIPQFAHCRNLLSLDLSYNNINGPLNGAQFALQANLIDLYLGHNQLDSIGERAFFGLEQLQVLEVSNNRLKWIHSNAFLPLRDTLRELDLSNNQQLVTLSSIGLEKVSSLKAFGNLQLKELPHFQAARSLALTYAYHCCDYLENDNNLGQHKQQQQQQQGSLPVGSLIGQLIGSLSAKIVGVGGANQTDERLDQIRAGESDSGTNNLTEAIVWPAEYYRDSAAFQRPDERLRTHRRGLARRHAHSGPEVEWRRQLVEHNGLIDELVWQVEQTRAAHSIGPARRRAGEQDGWFPVGESKMELNLHKQINTSLNQVEQVAGVLRRKLTREPSLRHPKRHVSDESTGNKMRRRCLPEPNAFLPCQDLFDTWWLRGGIWMVFLLSFIGNILVIVVLSSVRQSSSASALTSIMWLAHSKRHIDVPRFLVINLAIADLLMALYLGILALVDLSTLGEFKVFAIKWQYSTGCKLAGFLGVLSSELSVFILAIITLERNYAITNAVHLNRRLSLQKAMLIMFIGYTFALAMAIMPLNGISDYRKFSICLPLDMDSSLSSQLYIITLISINTISFLLLLSCYLRMYCAIRGSQAWNTNDLRIAKRMSILVLTDFLCWMPIIVVGLASLFGHHLIGPNGIKILTIFILPLNSIANPFLYAITTKKFKRDLDTLFRRARSAGRALDCANSDKDPKIFFGYNQYQHELMMNKAKASKNTKLAKSGKLLLNNKQHCHTANHRRNNNTTSNTANNGQAARARYNNAAAYTANQVTMNRTTCSCGALKQAEPRRPSGSSEDRLVVVHANLARKCDEDRPATGYYVRPRIVLDTGEPLDVIYVAPASMKKSQSTNCELNNDPSQMLAAKFNKIQSNQPRCASASTRTEPVSRAMVAHPVDCQQRAPRNYCCCLHGHQGAHLAAIRAPADRPKSAEVVALSNKANKGAYGTHRVCLLAERDSSTASSHLVAASASQVRPRAKFLSVLQNAPIEAQAADRSASACGYPAGARTGDPSAGGYRLAADESRLRPVAGSYDTMQQDQNRSSDKLSLSISKLLFGPVAKAWSSIAISLNSSLTQVAAPHQSHQATDAAASRRDCCASAMSRRDSEEAMRELETSSNINGNENSLTIDDLLLISSPTNRLMRLSERRMSRSCEVISQLASNQQTMSTLSNTSTSGNEYTSTSLGDYDDDQRILLATINRLRDSRRRVPTRDQQQQQQLPQQQQQQQYLRNRCTRCRSWSPALLSKLEECIYQLKFKIPGLGAHNKGAMGANYRETMRQDDDDDDSSGRDIDNDRLDDQHSDMARSVNIHDDHHQLIVGADSADSDLGEHCDEDSGDKFNERGLIEWSQKRHNMLRRHPFRRHSIKSNTNSDTLSTRTGGTLQTNISVSFDSNTGIPVPVPSQRSTNGDGEHLAGVDEINDEESL